MSQPILKATPDSFVGVAPVNWNIDNVELLSETHAIHWQDEATFEVAPSDAALDAEAGILARGTITLADGTQADLLVEEPIEELESLAARSKEPYTPAEVIVLQGHTAAWRFMLKGGTRRSPKAARDFARIAATFIEAGAAGIFMPGIAALHSPRFIKYMTMQLQQAENLTNLFIHAWHQDEWMMTRGLTAFGLPELETPVSDGMNAAYFRLMDVAASMITQNRPFPDDSSLTLGHQNFRLREGQQGPRDEQVPLSGTFGVQSIMPV
jgi:hypothetical protein